MLSSLKFAKDGLTTPLCVVVSSTGFWPVEGRMGPVLFPARKNEDPGKMRLVFRANAKADKQRSADGSRALQGITPAT